MDSATGELLIFDTGPLLHFAAAGWLGPLKHVVGARRAVVPDVVVAELEAAAARDVRVQAALEQPWIERWSLVSSAEIGAFKRFAGLLVHDGRNIGETGVLALAATTHGTAVLDDRVARNIARNNGIRVTGTLALLIEAIHGGLLTVRLVSALADDLLIDEYRLPFERGGFEKWAVENGLLT